MPALNRVMLMGNLTRDPELRYTPKGMAVTDIGLAINRRYRVENETREEVTFVDVTFWGRDAENVCKYCKKGRPLYVEGRLQMDTWDDKASGQKRTRMKIIGEGFQFIGEKGGAPAGADDYNGDEAPRGGGGGGGGGYSSGGGGGGGSGGGYSQRPQSAPPQRQAPPPQSNAFPPGLDDEDEIPF